MKLLGSPNRNGLIKYNKISLNLIIKNPIESFHKKKGWNGSLSISLLVPKGLLDPV